MTWTVTIIYIDGKVDHYPNLSIDDAIHAAKFAMELPTADVMLGISITSTRN